jgi:Flp pilus assembly protein TadG
MNIRFVQSRGGYRRNESGQALVEFALVVPIFLLLLLGVVEFARAWNLYEVLTDAGREGARRAVVDNPATTEADIVAAIQAAGSRAGVSIPSAGIQITGFHSGRGNEARVRIEYDHELKWVGALMGLVTGERTLTMVSEFAMRNE